MAEVLGPNTIIQRALPTGVDGTRVAQWQMRDGTTFAAYANDVALALGAVNQELNQMFGPMISYTEENMMEYADGGSVTELPEITDVDRIDMVHGQTIGHMIDLKAYGGAIGGSWRYFRDARQPQLNSTLRTIVNRGKWRFEKAIYTRAMTNTENSVGSAGYDVPFVRGTGGNVDFTPPAYGGEAFTSSHDHFFYNNTGYSNLLDGAVEHLEEHGHVGPYTAHVSRADISSYTALKNFVTLTPQEIMMVDRGGGTGDSQYFANGTPMVAGAGLFGYYKSDYGLIALHATARIPTTYGFMYKSYGNNDARNPIAVRVHPDQGFGLFIVPSLSDETAYPIRRLNVEFEFGVGVGEDRTNGVAMRKNSSWSNPTIS